MATKKAEPETPAPAAAHPHAPPETIGMVPIGHIRTGVNYRKTFDEASLDVLAESIRQHGVLKTPIVRPVGEKAAWDGRRWVNVDHYQLVDGERRYRAAKKAGLTELVCKVRPIADADLFQLRAVQLAANDSEPVPPSEEAAAYAEMAAGGRSLDAIAEATGRGRAFVRSVLAVAKCPGWFLGCVDKGLVTRAVAEIVGRVPGELARERAAACILLGKTDPKWLKWEDWGDAGERLEICRSIADGVCYDDALSKREAADLVRKHFTVQLKGAPFSLKTIDLVPSAGSCQDCPKRAGNDAAAVAEGTRPDVCLDPECYRGKVEAYRAAEVAKAAAKGVAFSELDDVGFPAPRGWAHLGIPPWQSDLAGDFPIGTKRRDEPLKDLLGKADCPRWLAFGRDGKPVHLVKVAEARKALVAAGVIKKEEKRREPKPEKPAPKPVDRAGDKDHAAGLSSFDVDGRALLIGVNVLAEYAEEQCGQLDEIEDACEDGPVVTALRLVARASAYDFALCAGAINRPVVSAVFPAAERWSKDKSASTADLDAIDGWSAAKCLAFLVRIAAGQEIFDGPNTETAERLLDFAELDWEQLRGQARRELAGGESAGEKVGRAEAGQAKSFKLDLPGPTHEMAPGEMVPIKKPKKKAKAS